MRPLGLCAFTVLAALVTGQARAVEPILERGTHELTLHISPDFEGAIGDTTFVEAGYGVFLRDHLQLRGTLFYSLLEDVAGPDGDYKRQGADLVSEYHFPLGAWVPYAGLSVGWTRSEFNTQAKSGVTCGPRAGIKYFVANNVALNVDIAYRIASADVFVNDFVAEDTDITTVIGLRVLFGQR